MAANAESISVPAGPFGPAEAAGWKAGLPGTAGKWPFWRLPGVVAAGYFVLSLGWILLSDRLVAGWANSGAVGTTKGCIFVAVSAGLLYAALRRQEARWQRQSEHRLRIESELRASELRLRSALTVAELAAESSRSCQARHRASEICFATIFRSNPIGTTLTRLDNAVIVDVNDVFLRESGYHRDELIGRTSLELGLWDASSARRALVDQLLAHGSVSNMEMVARGKNGAPRDLVVSFELIEVEGERFVLGMWTDVTERKRAELELRASEQRFREVVEAISEVFWVMDLQLDRITYVSPSFERIWGRRRMDLYASREVWIESIHPEDQERVLRAVAGTEAGRPYDETYRILRPDGSIRWIRDRGFPVPVRENSSRRMVGIADDITEKKELERQSLQAQRLEAIGTLASGIAHDLNNILSPILVIPDLLRPACPGAEERELLAMIEQSAKRGADIVKQLLTFSRGSEAMRFPLQVERLVVEMARLIRETFPREIEVREEIAGELPLVAVDATQIDQVLLNLCVNARDAMPDGGRLTLQVTSVRLDGDTVRVHPDARPGSYVIVRVGDTGVGIAPEIADRIFDPFFTTKAIGRGTGLGLSTVVGIVKGHQGFITVESTVGAGSVFSIHLPVASPDEMAVPPVSMPRSGPAHGEGVLIVDDEPAVAEAMKLVLGRNGYSVLLAADGEEALRLLELHGSQVQLVVSDMMMPRMGGLTLLQRVREKAPALPVIMTTGSIEGTKIDQLHALGVSGILHKPVAAAPFIDAVRQALA